MCKEGEPPRVSLPFWTRDFTWTLDAATCPVLIRCKMSHGQVSCAALQGFGIAVAPWSPSVGGFRPCSALASAPLPTVEYQTAPPCLGEGCNPEGMRQCRVQELRPAHEPPTHTGPMLMEVTGGQPWADQEGKVNG